ncbi:S8 family peptidase [Paraliobacillus sediminis]|uniref:S8 family peptidase n=1 Tax=Paraliobacillus sediminis TaxID=1885916 RepID=UPI000E3D78CD|nr:S8 family peptidase [Paraliobacillus sediminis]
MITQSIKLILIATVCLLFPIVISAEEESEKVIVLFKDDINEEVIENATGEISREIENVPAVAATVPTNEMGEIENNPNVIAVEKDITFEIKGQTVDWGIERVNSPKAWLTNLNGKGVKIAILDTGISVHEDLTIAGGISLTSYTSSYADDNGHGTFVAGIIGAKNNNIGTVGVAPESSIYAVKVADKAGDAYLSDILAAIDWSMENQMDIINMSLGATSDSFILEEAVNNAYQNDILVVASAGNDGLGDGSGDAVTYPAKYDSVIAVAATDKNDQRASFSATGSTVEIAAPGVSIMSTGLKNAYGLMDGTSAAVPFVAGNLALLKQQNETLAAHQLRSKLQENSIDLGDNGRDNAYGYGLTQAPNEQVELQENLSGVTLKSPTYVYDSYGNQLKTYSKGKSVKYKSFSNDWNEAIVYIDGKATTGYFKTSDVEDINTGTISLKGVGLKNRTNVYASASTGSEVLKSYAQGKTLLYQTFSSEWYQAVVYINGKATSGYINKADVEGITDNPESLRGIGLKSKTNVYTLASTGSKVLKSYAQGKTLLYQTFSGDWYQATVFINGKATSGYINKSDVEGISDNPEALRGIGMKNKTNVYTLASTGSKVLKSYAQGKTLLYQTFSSDWYQAIVYMNGKATSGYINKTDVEGITDNPEALRGIGMKNKTNVYTLASTGSKVLKSYAQGKTLLYQTFSSNWYQAIVYMNGKATSGYINKTDVEGITDNPEALRGIGLKNRTNVYTLAATGSSVLKSYAQGSTLLYNTHTPSWYQAIVYVNGKANTGYINKSDVQTN